MTYLTKVIIFLVIITLAFCRELETVNDDDLLHLIKTEDNIVVLFTKTNCDGCDDYEVVVENLHDDLVDSLGAMVVKAHNSPIVGIYDPTKEPSLIYFRRGSPLLYHGAINEEEILQLFTDNKEPAVRELSDENFEHLTQASTGATTGDWFLFFYSNDCVTCQRLFAIWEAVGATLKRRLNVARINRLEAGISTAKRFNIQRSPEFLLLRQGKFYRYKLSEHTPAAFIQFIEGNYFKESKGEPVPPISSQMSDYISMAVKFLLDRPYFLLFGAAGFGLTALTALIAKFMASKKGQTSQKTKKAK